MTATTPRANVTQQVNFLRRHCDASVNASGQWLMPNGLPAGAVITGAWISVTTAFNGTTPGITVGTTPGGANIAASSPVTALGTTPSTTWQTGAQAAAAADQDVYINVSGVPTAGVADVVIQFVPNIDG